MARSEIK